MAEAATTTPRTILVVDDDARMGDLLAAFLRTQGFNARILMDGLLVEPEVRRSAPDLVLLDVGLPGADGFEVCRRLRGFSDVPVILVSGRHDEFDRTLGLELGADDYVCKPFSPREVAARVKAVLRRAHGNVTTTCQRFGFRVDEPGRRIAWQGQWLPLTGLEFNVLRRLVTRPGQVFTREDLHDDGAQARAAAAPRGIDSHVKNIRRKLEAAGALAVGISSVYGIGYRLDAGEEVLQ